MTDMTGKPFPDLMKEIVLEPIGMRMSTFQQPIDPNRIDEVAYPVDDQSKPIAGGSHAYPEMGAGGLWTTPSDLARWIIAIQESLAGKPGQIPSAESARTMLTPIKGGYGLGVSTLTNNGRLSFDHEVQMRGMRLCTSAMRTVRELS